VFPGIYASDIEKLQEDVDEVRKDELLVLPESIDYMR